MGDAPLGRPPEASDGDFGGRRASAVCQLCGGSLARVSPREWVDRAANTASGEPLWHEHVPASCPECQVLLEVNGRCPQPCCLVVGPADALYRRLGEVAPGDHIGYVGNPWWLGRVARLEDTDMSGAVRVTLDDGTAFVADRATAVLVRLAGPRPHVVGPASGN